MTKTYKKKNLPIQSSENITVGDISGGVGFAIGRGAQTTVTKNASSKDDSITVAFKPIVQTVIAMPDGPNRDAANTVVKNLETEARNGDQADETKIQKWIDFLADIAPDVWEVAIDTLSNPIKGIGLVFKKVADKAKYQKEISHGT